MTTTSVYLSLLLVLVVPSTTASSLEQQHQSNLRTFRQESISYIASSIRTNMKDNRTSTPTYNTVSTSSTMASILSSSATLDSYYFNEHKSRRRTEDETNWEQVWLSFIGTYRIESLQIDYPATVSSYYDEATDTTSRSEGSIVEPPYVTPEDVANTKRDRYQQGIDNEYIFRIFQLKDEQYYFNKKDGSEETTSFSRRQRYRMSAELGEGNSIVVDFTIPGANSDNQEETIAQQQQDNTTIASTTRSGTKETSTVVSPNIAKTTITDLAVVYHTRFQKSKYIPPDVLEFENKTLSLVASMSSIELDGSIIRLHGRLNNDTNSILEGTRLSTTMEYSAAIQSHHCYYIMTVLGLLTMGWSYLSVLL